LLLLFFICYQVNTQNPTVDSISTRGFYAIAPKVGLGFHDFLNTEIASIYTSFVLQ
jgi:hypothetical protein